MKLIKARLAYWDKDYGMFKNGNFIYINKNSIEHVQKHYTGGRIISKDSDMGEILTVYLANSGLHTITCTQLSKVLTTCDIEQI